VTIHTLGDSHCIIPFEGIEGVELHGTGPVTLHRVGRPDDHTVADAISKIALTPRDALILSFGEVDIRSHIKPQAYRQAMSAEQVLQQLADAYAAKLQTLGTNGARLVVQNVPAPCTRERGFNAELPVAGTDEERAAYTRSLNAKLLAVAERLGLGHFDIYSLCADEHGMLVYELSDGYAHMHAPEKVAALLRAKGWLRP
jgi:hypothetical protein